MVEQASFLNDTTLKRENANPILITCRIFATLQESNLPLPVRCRVADSNQHRTKTIQYTDCIVTAVVLILWEKRVLPQNVGDGNHNVDTAIFPQIMTMALSVSKVLWFYL